MGTENSIERCRLSDSVRLRLKWLILIAALITCVATPRSSVHAQGPTPEHGADEVTSLEDCASGDGICLYEHNNYGGTWVRFTGTGCYPDFADIPFNDIASSIRLVGSYGGGKYVATLYEHASYGGVWTAFGADDSDFGNDEIWHDRASSICINTVPQCTGDGVYLYEHPGYGGRCRTFTGNYSDLKDTGFNDIASSVRLVGSYGGGVYKVTLCEQANYGGTCSAFTSDDSDLGNDAIGHDRTSSVKIEWNSNCSGDGVYVYEHENYNGRCWKWTSDDSDFSNENYHDIASSIRFVGSYGGGKYVATLYEHANYGGVWTAFGADDSDFGNDEIWHDRASSIRIQTVPQCTGDGVYLYEHPGYGGRCRKFTGDYADLKDTGFNDIASSVRLVGSYGGGVYKVTLCEQANYGGACSTFTADDSDLGNDAIGHDRTSSVKIEGISDTTPPAAITDLTASIGSTAGTVNLRWTAPGDDGNIGTASSYIVRYADSAIGSELGWAAATDVDGEPTPQVAGSSESMTVSGLTPGQTYYFAIRTQDEVPNLSGLSNSPGAAAGGGGGVDLAVESVTPVQVLERQSLVKDKATAVRVVVSKTGNEAVNNVLVRLTYNSQDFATFYVADSANIDTNYSLVNDNSAYPLSFATSEINKTIYFFGNGLTPAQASQYVVTATVDYLGNIAESEETNNSASATVSVYATSWPLGKAGHFFQWLDIVYVKADWGETPASEFDNYFNNSSAFLREVFPVSAVGFFPEKFASFSGADSTEYRGSDGRLDENELRQWFMNLNQRLILSRPYADAFVTVLPRDWFQNYSTWCTSCTGLTYQPGTQLGLAQLSPYSGIAGYKTSAHELGHVFGLWLSCEQYQNQNCNPNRKDGIGNPVYNGLWVEQRGLKHYSAEHRVYSFMGAPADADFWVDAGDYGKLLNDHKVTGVNSTALGQGSSEEKAVLVAGTLFDNGHIELEDWYVLSRAQTDELQPGDYYLRYLDNADQVLSELSFGLSLSAEGITVTQVPFIFRAPYISDTARIVIGEGTTDIVSRTVSAHAPGVTVVSPNGGEKIGGSTTVSWTATDQDGDDQTFAVLYSPDGGTTWEALVTGLTAQSYEWDISGLSPGNSYLVKVMATDGFNTGQDVSDAVFAIIGNNVYLPIILKSR